MLRVYKKRFPLNTCCCLYWLFLGSMLSYPMKPNQLPWSVLGTSNAMAMATHHMDKCPLETSNFRRFKWGGLSQPVLFQECTPRKLTAGTWKSPPWKRRNINKPPILGFKMLVFKNVEVSETLKLQSTMVTSSLPIIELFQNDLRKFENRQYSRPFFRWGLYLNNEKRRSRSFTSSKCHQFMIIFWGAPTPRTPVTTRIIIH